ncbi:MAG: hypothetical protein WBB89_15455 [Candidatus Acidiferrum sp.]
MSIEESQKPAKVTSSCKIEANRRNAQRSTGPKTSEGKVKSSQNSITHGIFVKRFLNGAAPETVAEIEALATGIREHCKPQGMLEEILVQKIVVETARYGRVLGFEHQQLTRDHAFHLSRAVDCIDRYTTSTSRALFRAIEELERLQATRNASEHRAALSHDSAGADARLEEEQDAPQGANADSSKSGTPRDAAGDVAA